MDIKSGAPLQPGATQPEHDGVSHKTETCTGPHTEARDCPVHSKDVKGRLYTQSDLERMARLVVQEAVAICDEKDRLLKDDFETAKFLHTQSAISALLTPEKLQQLREAVERP